MTKIPGKVIRGKKKGRELGFPTANIELKSEVESGVYAGWADSDGKRYKAGIFVSSDGKLLEAHLIGFLGDLYGKEIDIEIASRLRDVKKFESEEELKEQIKKDIKRISNS